MNPGMQSVCLDCFFDAHRCERCGSPVGHGQRLCEQCQGVQPHCH